MKPYWQENGITLYCGDNRIILPTMEAESVNCCVTSPPYWGLRDYGNADQIGLEQTPEQYVAEMVKVFREVRRVLRDDGTLWLNLGDSYCAHPNQRTHNDDTAGWKQASNVGSRTAPSRSVESMKPKDLAGIPWMVAFALRADGWYLRQDIIWHKPNPMPESVTDRCTKAHEYLFLLSKSATYHCDMDAIKEPAAESNAARPRMGQGTNTQYKQKRGWKGSDFKPTSVKDKAATAATAATAASMNGRTNEEKYTRNKRDVWDVDEDELSQFMEWKFQQNPTRRDVWTVPLSPYSAAHFATFPPDLIEPCIKAGVPLGGVCLDPFFGAGTTGLVCQRQHVRCIGTELNPNYCAIAQNRLAQGVLFGTATDRPDTEERCES